MKKSCSLTRLPVIALLAWSVVAQARSDEGPPPPQGPYAYRTERNVFITMRDGTRLATDIYLPNGRPQDKYPVVLVRTPYGNIPGSNGNDYVMQLFATHGYAVAIQDKRGKFRSEGVYSAAGGDANDGYDSIDWLSKQPWSNGRIGTFGCSYAGDVQIYLAQTRHPALKAMIPQASGSGPWTAGNKYRQFGIRQGGAVNWATAIGWFSEAGQKISPKLPTTLDPADYAANLAPWNQLPKPPVIDLRRAWYHLPMKDALRDQGLPPTDFDDIVSKPPADPYWAQFPYMTESYRSDVPALFVNSWYDFAPDMTLFEFNWFRTHSVSEQARSSQYAIISPGVHCSSETGAVADAYVGTRAVGDTRFDYWQTYLTWFDYWLKDDPVARQKIESWPRLRYYVMGANRWKSAAQWPPDDTRFTNYYLGSGGRANSLDGDGRLDATAPADAAGAVDTFVYDPASPVPSLGGGLCCTGTPELTSGAFDQRPIEARDDVLVYTSDPLPHAVEVTGPVEAVLYVSSSARDTDFTVKLVDVYPDGRAFNVVESILRARYRDGQDSEVWMQPDQIYPIRIPVGDTSNSFGAGHRIRVEISSSNFPTFDRNLNTGGVNAEDTHWVVATNRVHHSAQYPSHIVLPVAASR